MDFLGSLRDFKENVFRENVVSLWQQGCFCDVEVNVNSQKFQAHRVVLAAGSDYMKARLTSGMSDSSGSLELTDMDGQVFQVILHYLYNKSLLIPVLRAADRLQVRSLVQAAAAMLQNELSHENCIAAILVSEQLSLANLKFAARNYIANHFASVSQRDDFGELATDELRLLLADDLVGVPSEAVMFEAVVKWLKSQRTQAPKETVGSLLALVRFPTMSESYVKDTVRQEALMTSGEGAQALLNAFQTAFFDKSSVLTQPRGIKFSSPKKTIGNINISHEGLSVSNNVGEDVKCLAVSSSAMNDGRPFQVLLSKFPRNADPADLPLAYCGVTAFEEGMPSCTHWLLNLPEQIFSVWTGSLNFAPDPQKSSHLHFYQTVGRELSSHYAGWAKNSCWLVLGNSQSW